jgi:hypothetical protein
MFEPYGHSNNEQFVFGTLWLFNKKRQSLRLILMTSNQKMLVVESYCHTKQGQQLCLSPMAIKPARKIITFDP